MKHAFFRTAIAALGLFFLSVPDAGAVRHGAAPVVEIPVRRPVPVSKEPRMVRVELRSRPLTSSERVGTAIRDAVGVDEARHDHVFVYDAKTGELLDNIGWTGKNGQKGSVFNDKSREKSYDPAFQTLEMRYDDYLLAKAAFKRQTADWRYEVANAATDQIPQAAAGTALVAGLAGSLAGPRAGLEAGQMALRAAAASIVSSEEYKKPKLDNCDPDDDLAKCLPGVNCQLWASQFFDYLDYVATARKKAEEARKAAEAAAETAASAAKPAKQAPKTFETIKWDPSLLDDDEGIQKAVQLLKEADEELLRGRNR